VQEVGWVKGCTVRAGDYNFFTGEEMKINNWEQGFSVHHRIVSAVKRVEFVSDKVSYIALSGRWCNIIVLNVYATSEDISDYLKEGFYEKLEQFCYNFPKYHIKILLEQF
jgi:hypothetical protein